MLGPLLVLYQGGREDYGQEWCLIYSSRHHFWAPCGAPLYTYVIYLRPACSTYTSESQDCRFVD